MTIVRAPRPEAHFTVLSNSVLRNPDLSFRSRGILAYLLSMPDNWHTSPAALERAGGEGLHAVRTSLKELEEAGYLRRLKRRDDAGRWVWETWVYDEPVAHAEDPPEVDKPAGHAQGAVFHCGVSGGGNSTGGNRGDIRRTEEEELTKKDPPPARSPEVERVIERLAAAVEGHRGRAPNTKPWARPVDLLLRRGSPEWARPEPVPVEEVLAMIDVLFSDGAVPGRGGFCWADQVRSGDALRRHWSKLEDWRARRSRTAGGASRRVVEAYEAANIEPGGLLGPPVEMPRLELGS